MNKDIRDRWTTALRSGKYKQGRRQLASGIESRPTFCCLGVLCDLHSAETGEQWKGNTYMLQGVALPQAVLEWAGLLITGPNVLIQAVDRSSLAAINDQGFGFDEIADIIEGEL